MWDHFSGSLASTELGFLVFVVTVIGSVVEAVCLVLIIFQPFLLLLNLLLNHHFLRKGCRSPSGKFLWRLAFIVLAGLIFFFGGNGVEG